MVTLRRGSRGSSVRRLQEQLIAVGALAPSARVDGIFGRVTERAVRDFDAKHGLPVNGVVEGETWAALAREVARADSDGRDRAKPPRPLPPMLGAIEAAGLPIYWRGDHHLTLFGVRARSRVAGRFDDLLGVARTVGGDWEIETYRGTTDPGGYWLRSPSKIAGTAILAAGHYRDVWTIDLHAGKYPALCQRRGPVSVYRDPSRDEILTLDPATIETGFFGINLHRSSSTGESTVVDRWSAGCQVFARGRDFDRVMLLAREQVERTGIETFSYSLIDESPATVSASA